MTTQARDFEFAGAIVQKLYMVMVVITQNFQCIMYGGGHIYVASHLLHMLRKWLMAERYNEY